MRFNVAQLLKEPPGTIRDYTVDEVVPSLDEGLIPTEPLQGNVRLHRTNRGILVDANLSTAIQLECSRCIEPFILPVRLRFSEEFLPVIDPLTGLPNEIPPDTTAFVIDEDNILDLGEAVRQFALLEVPLQPLCSVVCRGLCPECGQNLNVAVCGCKPAAVDPRMAKLAELLENSEEKAITKPMTEKVRAEARQHRSRRRHRG